MNTQDSQSELDEIVEKLWWGGFGTHKASLIDDNSRGIRRLEDEQKLEAKQAIEAYVTERVKEAYSEGYSDGRRIRPTGGNKSYGAGV